MAAEFQGLGFRVQVQLPTPKCQLRKTCTNRDRETCKYPPPHMKDLYQHRETCCLLVLSFFYTILATHQQHISNTLATHQQHISNTLATHQQHISNTLATHLQLLHNISNANVAARFQGLEFVVQVELPTPKQEHGLTCKTLACSLFFFVPHQKKKKSMA